MSEMLAHFLLNLCYAHYKQKAGHKNVSVLHILSPLPQDASWSREKAQHGAVWEW